MLRSGFILGISGPAALLTVLVHPIIQREADMQSLPALTRAAPAIEMPALSLPQAMPVVHVSTAQPSTRSLPRISEDKSAVIERPALKPRRTMRDGCEGAISSLAGPEARRMIPGRCIA